MAGSAGHSLEWQETYPHKHQPWDYDSIHYIIYILDNQLAPCWPRYNTSDCGHTHGYGWSSSWGTKSREARGKQDAILLQQTSVFAIDSRITCILLALLSKSRKYLRPSLRYLNSRSPILCQYSLLWTPPAQQLHPCIALSSSSYSLILSLFLRPCLPFCVCLQFVQLLPALAMYSFPKHH